MLSCVDALLLAGRGQHPTGYAAGQVAFADVDNVVSGMTKQPCQARASTHWLPEVPGDDAGSFRTQVARLATQDPASASEQPRTLVGAAGIEPATAGL